MSRFAIYIIGVTMIVVDLWWLKIWPLPAMLFNLSLLLSIIVTIRRGFIPGLMMSVVAAIGYSVFSVVGDGRHYLAFILAVVACSIISSKFVANRSTLSLVTTVSLSTVIFYLALMIWELIGHWLGSSLILIPYSQLLISGLTQAICHPLIVSLVWKLFRRGQYDRLQTVINRPF